MIPSYFAGKRPRIFMTLLASAAVATTGCSNMTSTASSGGVTAAIKVGGKIHGGNQPVAGATVNLYFASQATFAAGASLVATTLSASDGSGSFSFTESTGTANDGTSATFSCPTNGNNPYVFVVAKGGTTVNTPGASPNPDAEFIAPMGKCADVSASTSIYMSEVVTVATMAAIHQYMNPTASASPIESTVGSDGIFISDGALARSFDSVFIMASSTTGLGNASVTRLGDRSGAAGVTVTITPELAKINQLANIISTCINQTTGGSAACTSIYASAAPPADAGTTSVSNAQYSTATDLLTALYYIFTNPTNGGTANLTTLYNLSAASGAPYQPTLTTPPTDWSIGLKYVASGTCTNSSSVFISNPTSLAIDQSGNLLIGNASNNSTGSIAQLAASGTPAACFPVTVGGSVSGGTTPLSTSGTVSDIAANIWVGSSSTNEIIRWTPPSPTASAASLDIPTVSPVVSITTDGLGDVFFSTQSNDLYEIVNGSSITTPTVPVKINTISIGAANHIMIDSANRIWASSGAGSISATAGSPDPTNTFLTNFTTTQYTTAASYGIASTSAAGSGVYTSSLGDNSITYLSGSGTTFAAAGGFPVTGGGISAPYDIALDGAQNVWTANGGGGIAAFSKFGAALTPATGFQKDASYLGGQNALVIDSSGNIWLGLTNSNTITEIVGAAVPVYQPYATGLQPVTNRFQTLP